jgi:hypothetical protein
MPDVSFTPANIRPGQFALIKKRPAAGDIGNGDAVVLLGDDTFEATTNATDGMFGVAVANENHLAASTSAAAGDEVEVVYLGIVEGYEGLVPGQLYYLSANEGNLATTGTIAAGFAFSTTQLFVRPALADIPS